MSTQNEILHQQTHDYLCNRIREMNDKIVRLVQELQVQSRNNYSLQLQVESLNEQLVSYANRLGIMHISEHPPADSE